MSTATGTTQAVKVTLDRDLYAEVKALAKAEKTTVKALVEAAFRAYVAGEVLRAPAPEAAAPTGSRGAVLAMLAERRAAAIADERLAAQAADPVRGKRARNALALLGQLEAAAAAAEP